MTTLPYILALFLILLATAFLRLLYVLPSHHNTRPPRRPRHPNPPLPTHLLILLGSGGHTAEMLSLLTNLSRSTYTHRSYIISSGDDFSAQKAEEFEASLAKKQDTESRTMGSERSHGAAAVGKDDEERNADGEQREEKKPYSIHIIPRARQIHQPLHTTALSLPPALLSSLRLLLSHPPTLILTNGPGTALLLLLASLLLRYFSFLPPLRSHGRTRSIYIESWARVRRPSLTGRIVVWGGLCDRVVVQWRGLERGGWGEFRGVLVR